MRAVLAIFAALLSLLATVALAASGDAQIIAAVGSVTFNAKPVKVGDVVSGPGVLKTGDTSSAKVFLRDARTLSLLKANTSVELNIDKKNPGSFRLVEGLSRWVVGKVKPGQTVSVSTKTAVMGVRGTEFMAVYNPVLGEAEIISFNGTVEFKQSGRPKNVAVVKTGQWGGVGGRFGKDIGPIRSLPKNALDYFRATTEVQTTIQGAAVSNEFHGHTVPK